MCAGVERSRQGGSPPPHQHKGAVRALGHLESHASSGPEPTSPHTRAFDSCRVPGWGCWTETGMWMCFAGPWGWLWDCDSDWDWVWNRVLLAHGMGVWGGAQLATWRYGGARCIQREGWKEKGKAEIMEGQMWKGKHQTVQKQRVKCLNV